MGIWDVTKRMIQGKPAFEAPQNSGDDWDDDAPTTDFAEERQQKRDDATSTSLVDENGYKQIPPAALTDVDYKLLGDRFELWATVSNQSDRPVHIDKITLFGTTTQHGYPLPPRGQRVFKLYGGSLLKHDNYKTLELYYKDVQTGDYFRADHMIEYSFSADNSSYKKNSFQLIEPIRDV